MTGLVEPDTLALLVAAVGLASVAFVCFRQWPRAAGVSWLLVVAFVPYWLAVKFVIISLSPASAAGLLVLAALLPVSFRRVAVADWMVAFLILIGTVAYALGYGTLTTAVLVVVEWGVGYLLGRVVPRALGVRWVYGAIAVVFTLVAMGALAEFATGVNPFVLLAFGDSYAVWGPLQERGGQLRVEGAFGHSIALGAVLALSVPMVLASRFRGWVRVVMVLVISLAAVCTLSRIAIACVLVGLVLTLLTQGRLISVKVRATLLTLLVVGAVLVTPVVLRVFAQAGSEATDSSSYRLDIGPLLSQVSVFGISGSATINANGSLLFSGFQSIDSAVLLLGLTYGAIALVVVIGLYLTGAWAVLLGRATPATVAVVALLPAYLNVALITQYSIFLWFCIGLAVTSQQERGNGDESPRQEAVPRTLNRNAQPRAQARGTGGLVDIGRRG
jgi:hypothetical protein